MLFTTVNYYESESESESDKKIEDNEKEQRECFICFDFQLDNNIIKLKNNTDFYKFCDCDGYIHVNCLNSWYEKNEECPICRNPMKKADNLELYNLYQYQYGVYMIYSYLVIKRRLANSFLFIIKLTHRMFLVLFVFIILNTINEIYNKAIYELEKEIHDTYLLDNYREPIINRIVPLP